MVRGPVMSDGGGLLNSPMGAAGYALAVAAVFLLSRASTRRQEHPTQATALAVVGVVTIAMGLALILLA